MSPKSSPVSPVLSRWSLLAVAALGAACGSPHAQLSDDTASVSPRIATPSPDLSCPQGAVVRRSRLAPGVLAWGCGRVEPAATGSNWVPQGPTLLIARRSCDDGQMHEVVVQGAQTRGEPSGVERGMADGRLVYTRQVNEAGDRQMKRYLPATEPDMCGSQPCAGWGASRKRGRTCRGMHLCGELVGYGECIDDATHTQGAHVDGQLEGLGISEDLRGNGRRRGSFARGRLHGSGSVVDADGDVFVGHFEHGLRHGSGRMTFAAGGWLTAVWIRGEMHGRVTRVDANGARVVTRWRHGDLVQFIRRYHVKREGGQATVKVTRSGAGAIVGRPPRPAVTPVWLAWQKETRGPEERLHFWRLTGPTRPGRLPQLASRSPGEWTVRRVDGRGAAVRAEIAVIEGQKSRLGQGEARSVRILSWVEHGPSPRHPVAHP